MKIKFAHSLVTAMIIAAVAGGLSACANSMRPGTPLSSSEPPTTTTPDTPPGTANPGGSGQGGGAGANK